MHPLTEFRRIRETGGLTVADVANSLGYSLSNVYRWDRGSLSPKPVVLDRLRELSLCPRGSEASRFRFIDLFAGIGAMRLAFEAIGGECVFTSEWDRFCRQTYSKNFAVEPEEIAGDIRSVPPEDIPRFDVLVAGFPCQPFSIAGVSKKASLGRPHGFDDPEQGNLFFRVLDILHHHRPAAFLLENVRNLISHDRGNTFEIIHRLLSDDQPPPVPHPRRPAGEFEALHKLVEVAEPLGYHISARVIDAKAWVPQHRERIFIVGFRDDVGFSLNDLAVPPPESGPRMRTILHECVRDEPDGRFVLERGRVNPRYTLSDELWEYLQEYAELHRQRGNGFGYGLVGPDDVSRTLSARYFKDGSEILVDKGAAGAPRRLTPRECARLMGFSRPGQREWTIPVSDTQAYRQFGNAAVVPTVEHIARYMGPYIQRLTGREIGWQSPLPLHLGAAGG